MMKENLIKFFNLIKNSKQAKGLLIVGTLVIFIFTLGFSLSMFTSNNSSKIANIKVNDLSFNITTNNATSNDRILHLKAAKTELFNVIITNLNNINTTYELIYDICTNSECTNTLNSLPNGVKVEYLTENSDTLNGKINNNNGTKTINIITTNTTSSDVYIRLNLNAGYDWNNLVLANQIKEYKIETNIIAYVDGVEQKNYPDNCNYTAEAKAYIGTQEVALENLNVTCDKTTKKWTTNFTGHADRIEVKFTYIPIPTPVSFATDSWETIAANVKEDKEGTASVYPVGDTKEVTIDGTNYTVRIANNSNYDCTLDSKTACGFVVEFVDIIEKRAMNSTITNVGGWPATAMYKYLNGDTSNHLTYNGTNVTLYSKLPKELRDVIADTTVISGHGSKSGETNFTSTDKIYLLSSGEIWSDCLTADGNSGFTCYDTASYPYKGQGAITTRQLDYYSNKSVSTQSNNTYAVKKFNGTAAWWWLRAAISNLSNTFGSVYADGSHSWNQADTSWGVAPAFRIG
ncbi:MAG: hypothetical protein J6K23_03360 [Bacilli bacterium]|nr:hypothetical protein [Bacilli bacterium]